MRFNWSGLASQLRTHRQVLVVVTLLTLAVTYPTISYILRTDVFWLPGDDYDVFIKYWDVWYGGQFLRSQADRFFTDLMFYPKGLSLNYHPFFIPQIIVVNALSVFLPVSNAISLTYLLIIASCAFSAYAYLLWLFKDKWIALFGAVVFGFSPHVVGHPYHPDIMSMATVPLALYCLHRGVREGRTRLIMLAGLLTGLTTVISMYMYVCILIMLGFYLCAFAKSRLADKRFWLDVLLLLLVVAVSSIWRVYPLLVGPADIDEVAAWHGDEIRSDATSYLINYRNPIIGPLAESIGEFPPSREISTTSYLGYLPLVLILYGFVARGTRRRMRPWALLCAVFLVLRLGSNLNINGILYPDILLPKHYMDEFLPSVFESFWEVDNFMMGALLPFAVLACYGLSAFKGRFAIAAKPAFIVALLALVALEYWIPVQGRVITDEQVAFLDWLAAEDDTQNVRLINLPMGRRNSKLYNLYQALSGFPHAEGAISRTPAGAFDYFRANYLLNAWYGRRQVHCDTPERDVYLGALTQLEQDGFSHVVFHRQRQNWSEVRASFEGIEPSYIDDFVSIYRLQDLRDSCPAQLDAHQRFAFTYAEALKRSSILYERSAVVIIFPPTAQANDYFMRYLRVYSEIDATVVTVTSDEQESVNIEVAGLPDATIDLQEVHEVWLVNDHAEFSAERTVAYQEWFTKRYKFCARFMEEEGTTIDAYLKSEYPCAAVDGSSPDQVRYDSGLRLHHASFDVLADQVRFYLAWTHRSNATMVYSIQIFGEDGTKALQIDEVIYDQLLAVHEVDTAALVPGAYTVQLIAYDFETRASQGGVIVGTAERFERELLLGSLQKPG
jgi:hypothetical protein